MSGAAANPNEGVALKVRIVYSKLGKVRFTSHRDMARIWERSLRKAGIPIAYSQGFSPRAKLSFGLALPTTFESSAEYVDLSLAVRDLDVAGLPKLLTPALPVGVEVYGAAFLPDRGVISLQQAVTSTTWQLSLTADSSVVASWIDSVLDAPEIEITRERKGKSITEDVRPAVLSLELSDDGAMAETFPPGTCHLIAELATQPRALRPNELLGVFSPEWTFVRGRRLHQWIASDGARLDPLSIGAAQMPHRELCAS